MCLSGFPSPPIPRMPVRGSQTEPALCLWRWGYCRLPGIAFLWFIGVVRDRLGPLEDQFFATVFFGSGLLFLALAFVSAALAGGILATYALEQRRFIDSGMYTLTQAVLYRITNVYAVKMAGVFMISLATIWVRTRLMPRWLALLTYVLALGLLLSITSSLWVTLIFPGWSRRGQRLHPRHESAQPIVNAVTHAYMWRPSAMGCKTPRRVLHISTNTVMTELKKGP